MLRSPVNRKPLASEIKVTEYNEVLGMIITGLVQSESDRHINVTLTSNTS